MFTLFCIPFILLIIIVSYYFIYQNNLNHDLLFYILINFIFLIILPLYYFYFKSFTYSIIISVFLCLSALLLNLKAKEILRKNKLLIISYFIFTILIIFHLISLI